MCHNHMLGSPLTSTRGVWGLPRENFNLGTPETKVYLK